MKKRRHTHTKEEDPLPRETEGSKRFLFYLIATAVLCGALVMVIEILGSRVIGPFFGVSLFVWTSLITVTLASLAGGYAAGGILSDRRADPTYLYTLILVAGVLTLTVPVLKGPVLRATMSWGLRTGAFTSALVLFGPPLFLLGCVSPYLVKLAAKEVRSIGRTVGVFYAFSTIGSVFGTMLTGFLFIAYLRVSVIFLVVGALLIAVASGYFLFFRRAGYALAALVLPLAVLPGASLETKILPNGTRITELFDRDTFYGNLKVVEYSYGNRRQRDLMIDGLTQGGMDMQNGLSVYDYIYYLQFLPYSIEPRGTSCLVIGLGAGLVPRWYEKQGISTDVVDIDPNIVRVARDYFGFSTAGDIVVADARRYLHTTGKRYDYMVLDVFSGDTTPGHMLSVEALRLMRARMTDRGVLAINLIGSLKRDPFMTASVLRTLREVFPAVLVYPNYSVQDEDGGGNITVIAHNRPERSPRLANVTDFSVHPRAQAGLSRHLGTPYRMPDDAPAVVLTDDYNPIDFYDVRLKEWVRRTILDVTDTDLLL